MTLLEIFELASSIAPISVFERACILPDGDDPEFVAHLECLVGEEQNGR